MRFILTVVSTILLEVVYFVFYPLILVVLRLFGYQEAIQIQGYNTEKSILIHAASLGEVNAAHTLILSLKDKFKNIVISTTTKTGKHQAEKYFPDVNVFISPLDILHLRLKQLSAIRPQLIIIIETELWPQLLLAAKIKSIPIVIANARISDRSLRRYLRFHSLLQYISSSVKCVLAQSETDMAKFELLFASDVYNAGNLKFSLTLQDYDSDLSRKSWGFSKEDFIITWGSSRPGEELILYDVYQELSASIRNLKVIIAPRHLNRIAEVRNIFQSQNFQVLSEASTGQDILIIDNYGSLLEAYAVSDISIVGGSFYEFGGHNPLEPAFYSKPIIMGQYYNSCKDSVTKLLNHEAILITDKHGIVNAIQELYDNRSKRTTMGSSAKSVLTQNRNALSNHMVYISKMLINV